jgi:hypothetical protein
MAILTIGSGPVEAVLLLRTVAAGQELRNRPRYLP